MNTKVQRALAIALALWLMGTAVVFAEPHEHTNCEDFNEAPIGVFVDKACLPTASWWPITTPWEKSLENEAIDDSISSIYIKAGWSIMVAENSDGTGLTTCLTETKWVLEEDTWPESETKMGNSISFIKVHDNATCAEEVQVEKEYCDDLPFAGVALFDLPACEQPGLSRSQPVTGTINLHEMSRQASSLYVSKGWSLLISDGEQEMCIFETKWDLSGDEWENGVSQDNSITHAVAFDDPNCGFDELPVPDPTYCDSLSFVGAGLFDLAACEQPGMAITTTITGTLQLGEMSGLASSAYIAEGWSLLASNGDEEYCLIGTKWDLSKDKWLSGAVQNNTIISATAYANATCQSNVPPVVEKQQTYLPAVYTPPASTYCDSLHFTGVALFAAKSCELPGQTVGTQEPGELILDFSPMSVYVSSGFSVSVFGTGDEITCLTETKWNLAEDNWPGTTNRMTDIQGALVYQDTNCGAD